MKNVLGKFIILSFIVLGWWWVWGVSKLPRNFRYSVFRFREGYIELITAEPNQKMATVLRFPNQLWIRTIWGRGEWKIDSLEILAKKYGNEWLNDTVAEVLGNGTAINYRDLKMGDRLALYQKINNENSKFLDVEKLNLGEEKIAPDGEKIIFLSNKWESYKGNIFLDGEIAAFEVYVQVENASGLAGLGTRAANSIDITGAHVFDVSKSDEVIDKCQVLANNSKDGNPLLDWLVYRFDCSIASTKEDKIIILRIGKEWGEKVKNYL